MNSIAHRCLKAARILVSQGCAPSNMRSDKSATCVLFDLDKGQAVDAIVGAFRTGTAIIQLRDGIDAAYLIAHNLDEHGRSFIRSLLSEQPVQAIGQFTDAYPSGPVPIDLPGAPAWSRSNSDADRARTITDLLQAAAAASVSLSETADHIQVHLHWDGGDPIVTVNLTGIDRLVLLDSSELLDRMLTAIGPVHHLRATAAPAIVETFSKAIDEAPKLVHQAPWHGVIMTNEIEIDVSLSNPIDKLRLIANGSQAADRIGVPIGSLIVLRTES